MDSIFKLDPKGYQKCKGEKEPNIVYEGNWLLSKKNERNVEVEEVKLFGLDLDCSNVLNVVSSLFDNRKSTSKTDKHSDVVVEHVENVKNSNEQKSLIGNLTLPVNNGNQDLFNWRQTAEVDMRRSKRALDPGLDQRCSLPNLGKRRQSIINRTERAKTAGSGWFDLSATDITEEMRNELKIIQMRSVLNPKHFYKKSDSKSLPKYFHIGTVQNLAIDHYNEKKARTSKALVNDLLEDQNFQMFNKRKYNEVIQRTDKYAQRKIIKKMKKLKKNK